MRCFARTTGATLLGTRAVLVDVQAAFTVKEEAAAGTFRIVGLPDSALREGRERIRGAAIHGGFGWPFADVTVNLAPAAARKAGAALDLPIALAVLGADGVLGEEDATLGSYLCLGELTLDGCVRPVRGALAAVEAARDGGVGRALVPRENLPEAAAVAGVECFGVRHLADAVGHLSGVEPLVAAAPQPWSPVPWDARAVAAVRGQPAAVRCALLAAAGGHNLLMTGPPGAGKTLLARALAGLLPPPTYEEALEASRIHSVAGLLGRGLLRRRPFRAPHHTTSLAGLVGGGSVLRPGEISLAHTGLLFLDELPEFPRPSLEALRQPLEDGHLLLARAAGSACFPAEFLLAAAMNPCPCGWRGTGDRCRCVPGAVARYAGRVSGPLRDRFDLHVTVRPVPPEALLAEEPEAALPSERFAAARERQEERARRLRLPRPHNARIPAALLPGAVGLDARARAAAARQAEALGLTARGLHRALRVARTIADLEGSDLVRAEHVEEAAGYR